MSLHPCFRRRWLLQVCVGKPSHRKQAFVDISVFLWLRKQQPRFAQGQPKGSFQTKELDRTTEAYARMNIVWEGPVCWRNVPTCGKIAVWQLCRERQPAWNSHDGLNLTCLDQCHGVRSPGASSSQGGRQRIVMQKYKFDPWVHILVFAEGDCCRFA